VCIPPIPASVDEIHQSRRDLDEALTELERTDLHVSNPLKQIGVNHFYLAYQGLNDRDFNTRLASLCEKACPRLSYVAPHCFRSVHSPGGRRIRIGFVSAYFQQHSVGRLMAGLIAQLSREKFHVTVVRLPGEVDAWSREIDQLADAVLTTSNLL